MPLLRAKQLVAMTTRALSPQAAEDDDGGPRPPPRGARRGAGGAGAVADVLAAAGRDADERDHGSEAEGAGEELAEETTARRERTWGWPPAPSET